jgi:hypothetical protein
MLKSMLCIVSDAVRAEQVIADLRSVGFLSQEISVLFPEPTETREFARKHDTQTSGTVSSGAGGALRGAIFLLAGSGTLAIAGADPFIGSGPILVVLRAESLGSDVDGVAGRLTVLGVPEFVARQYEQRLSAGNVLISVLVTDPRREKLAREVLDRDRAEDISLAGTPSVPSLEDRRYVPRWSVPS